MFLRTAAYVRYKTTTPIDKRDVYGRVLLFGGGKYFQSTSNNAFLTGTWVYTPKVNSWFVLQLKVEPSRRTGHSLTTICENNVILFGGYDGESHVNDLWLFEGIREEWKQLSDSVGNMKPSPRSFHSAAAFRSTGSCTYRDSLLLYGGVADFRSPQSDLWELQFAGRHEDEIVFSWVEHSVSADEKDSFWPPPLFMHSAVLVNSQIMLMGGGLIDANKTVAVADSFWLYNKTSQIWFDIIKSNFTFFNFRRVYHLYAVLNMSPLFLLVYHPGKRHSLFIKFGKVYAFDETSKTHWAEQDTIIDSATPGFRMFGFSSVVVGEKLFVFGGMDFSNQFTASVKVWNLEEVTSGAWKWQLLTPDPNNYISVTTFPWILLSDKLIRSVSTELPSLFALDTQWLEIFLHYLLVPDTERELKRECILGNCANHFSDVISSVSQLDLYTRKWAQYVTSSANIPVYYTASTGFQDRAIVTYGGLAASKLRQFNARDHAFAVSSSLVSVYCVSQRRWFTTFTKIDEEPVHGRRLFPTIVDIGNNTLMLFGGLSVSGTSGSILVNRNRFKFKNDIWMLTIEKGWEYTEDTDIAVTWKEVIPSMKRKSGNPEGRFGHSAVFVDGKLVILGGRTATGKEKGIGCVQDMWYFNLRSRTWTKSLLMEDTLRLLYTGHLCRVPLANVGNRILTINHTHPIDNSTECLATRLMSSFPKDHIWIGFPFTPFFVPHHLFGWRGMVVAVEGEILEWSVTMRHFGITRHQLKEDAWISIMTPSCPEGHVSENWTEDYCRPCQRGQFSSTTATSCNHCPGGLTTTAPAASSILNCSCPFDYCSHGACFVAQKNGQVGAECVCHFGYTGGKCQYPTYFVIAGSSAVGLVVITLLLIFVQQMMKFRKLKLRRDGELEEMRRVWNIASTELQVLTRIDVESPGGFGEVHKARYRDMTVAVKRLKEALTTGPIERDFEREIQFMKSVRHPNLVMFFGAGRFDDDDCPFLVVEFMQNGSLFNLLTKRDVYISKSRQLQFCLDSARGIEFLHSQRPSRIHRDIKSGNLLLSENWVVKVADFGCARLVKGRSVLQKVKRKKYLSTSMEISEEPLLQANNDLSDNVGTLFWRAPEVFAGETYGTAVDIYRLGQM